MTVDQYRIYLQSGSAEYSAEPDRKSTRLNSSHGYISYAVFCLKKKIKARLAAIRFDFDGYSKFDLGGRVELTRKITKQDEAGLIFSVRHVKIIDADIKPKFLGDQNYFVNTLGFTNTLDMRESPFVTPRGFLINNTLDLASSAFGSDIEFIRGTIRTGYYLPFGPKPLTPGVVEDKPGTPLQRWFQQSWIGFGARAGIIHSLTVSGPEEAFAIPIDER